MAQAAPSATLPAHDAPRDVPKESSAFRDEDLRSVAIRSSLNFAALTTWLNEVVPPSSGEMILCCNGGFRAAGEQEPRGVPCDRAACCQKARGAPSLPSRPLWCGGGWKSGKNACASLKMTAPPSCVRNHYEGQREGGDCALHIGPTWAGFTLHFPCLSLLLSIPTIQSPCRPWHLRGSARPLFITFCYLAVAYDA